MALSIVATFIFSGWEGVLAPFRLQAGRGFNGESTYDAINYLFGAQLNAKQIPLLPQALQLASALGGAAMRPRTFTELIDVLFFAVLGFMTFSTFYSPQYVLWILPLVCFSGSRVMLVSAVVFSWLTYLYFPIVYDLAYDTTSFKAIVVAVTMLRLFIMLLTLFGWYRARFLIGAADEGRSAPRSVTVA
jgi:hypothetical protein